VKEWILNFGRNGYLWKVDIFRHSLHRFVAAENMSAKPQGSLNQTSITKNISIVWVVKFSPRFAADFVSFQEQHGVTKRSNTN